MRKLYAADLFCGAGGTSTGLLRAAAELGIEVDLLAVNHWPAALATHELNHPGVRHIHEDLAMIDPRRVVPRGKLDLLWASPECTSHSYSRGGRPISEQSRSTAWHPLKWCDQLNIKTVIIENVPAFRAWGPTDRNGKAIKKRKGETFQHYIKMLESMGYTVDHRILNAADFGAAQTRRRLFIVGVKGDHRIQWPRQTHAQPGMLLPGMKPWRGAKEVVDWSIKGKSIFNRKKPHAPKTLERILIGLEKFGPALRPYIPILRNHLLPRDIDDPIPTVAANGTHIGLAEPVLVQVSHGNDKRRGNEGRARSTDDPLFSLPGSNDQGIAEVAVRARPVDQPMPAITGSRETGVAEAVIVTPGGAWEDRLQSVDEPFRTFTGRESRALAAAVLIGAGGPEGQGRTALSVDEPLKTELAENHQALVEAEFVLPQRTFENMTADSVEKPLRTLTTKQRPSLVETKAFVLPHRIYDKMQADSIDAPLRTITGSGGDHGVVEPKAVIIPFNGEREGQAPRSHSIDEPLPTITSGGAGQKGVADPVLLKYSRTGGPRSTTNPLDTLTGKPRYGLVTPEVLAHCDSQPVGALTPLGVKIAPDLYLDILFRMLRVHELGQGQGFPKDYKFTGTVEEQVKQIGNAVEVHQGYALCVANLPKRKEKKSEPERKRAVA